MKTRKVVYENFKSIHSFIDKLGNRPLNAVFNDGGRLSSIEEEIGEKEPWRGTETYKQAEQLLSAGYTDPLEKMQKALLKIGQKTDRARPQIKNDVVGYAPNVPLALMGVPTNMMRRDRIAPKVKTIHLTYSITASSGVTPKAMILGGINFISLVNSLEKQGYRVKIDIIAPFVSDKTLTAFTLTLKDYAQATNLLKLSFPLVHPAMFRRFSFKYLETAPELKDKSFRHGYGRPLNHECNGDLSRERDYLKEHGILKAKNSYYCNVYTAMRVKNVEELAREMEII